MNKILLLLFVVLLSGEQSADAMSPSPLLGGSNPLLLSTGASDCKGPIATEAHPIIGAKLLAKMRREGRLPDSFVCGGCEYNLGGEPGVAYYVKTCR
jgi:hypothetical protein